MMRKLAVGTLFLLAYGARPAAAASCTIYTSSVAFGSYTATTTVNIAGTVTVNCNNGTAYQVALNAGTAAGATLTNRSMTGPSLARLGYEIYSDAGRTANWGNSSGTGWVTGTGNGQSQTLTMYAQIPANEFLGLGSYTDTITATISGGTFTTRTAQFSVTAQAIAACTISANPLSFGTYAKLLINSTSIITVTCTNTTPYNVGLNAGTATGATVTNRSMTGPASTLLSYKMFSNSARTANWGNSSTTGWVAGTGSGSAQTLTVYGQVPAGQSARPGSYADTITATVTY